MAAEAGPSREPRPKLPRGAKYKGLRDERDEPSLSEEDESGETRGNGFLSDLDLKRSEAVKAAIEGIVEQIKFAIGTSKRGSKPDISGSGFFKNPERNRGNSEKCDFSSTPEESSDFYGFDGRKFDPQRVL